MIVSESLFPEKRSGINSLTTASISTLRW